MPRTAVRRSASKPAAAEPQEEAPKRLSRRPAKAEKPEWSFSQDRPAVKSGWGAVEEAANNDFPTNFKVSADEALIKFLDDFPFAVYHQHWITREGKRSFTCIGQGCPLCLDLSDRPAAIAMFNVVEMLESGPALRVWETRTTVANTLKALSESDRNGPLSRPDRYFEVHRTGKDKKWTTHVTPVKERDLEDEWDVAPLTEDQIEQFTADKWDSECVYFQSQADLQEIADEVYNS